jgi:arylsulfatase A-like enzyme
VIGDDRTATRASRAPLPGPPPPATRAWAAFLGFCIAASVNGVLLLRSAPPWRDGGQWVVHWLDAASFMSFGGAVALAVALWGRFGPPGRRWGLGAVALAALGVAAYTLPDDLENFSGRMEELVPPALTLGAGIVLIASAVPLAAAVGRWLSRRAAGAALGIITAIAGLVLNASVLPSDYSGIHFFIAWCSATLAGQSLVERPLPRIRRLHQRFVGLPRLARVALSLSALLLGAAVLVVPPPASAAMVLTRSDGSAFHWFFSRLRAAGRRHLATPAHSDSPWFRERSALPPIVPSAPRSLPEDALVILLTMDALRAELIGSGDFDAELPNLARLRDQSVWFSEARAPGTLTKVSLSTLFMGTYFSQQYWTGSGSKAPREDPSPRFPALLADAGVRTISLRAITWLRNDNGVSRGFAEEHNVRHRKHQYTPAAPMIDQALRVLSTLDGRPTFLFMHLMDGHAPYEGKRKKRRGDFGRYVAELGAADAELGRLLEQLERPELSARTLLVVSADHGEAFGEHGSRTHGTTLYDETLRVPLMIRLPDRRARRVDARVGLIDVGPTLLDLMGVNTPGHFMGQSLVPFLRGESAELTRPLFAETRLMQAYITPSGLKLIFDSRRDRVELYDLKSDPGELQNLADVDELVQPPLAELLQFFEVHRLRRDGYEPPYIR